MNEGKRPDNATLGTGIGERAEAKENLVVLPNPDERGCVCRGNGWLRVDVPYGHPQFGKPVPCMCLERKRREKRREALLLLSGLPKMERVSQLCTFNAHERGVQQAYEVVELWIDQVRRIEGTEVKEREDLLAAMTWLVLRGPVGVGKTHLAMTIAKEAIDRLMVTLFATVPDLLDHLRAAYDPKSENTYDTLFEQMRNAEILILDDLGTQRSSPWANEKLFQLINYRYMHRLPTIVTMNESAWPHLEERIQSRLCERRLVTMVSIGDASDYRRREVDDADASG